ncbi:MAG: ClpXP protease specificity-enhancing factor [Gammaproteobacteria bacterium]
MTSSRPYLIRALYQWIVDNNLTPHILINAGHKGVQAPQQYAQDGRLILNISPTAVQGLLMGNELIEFNARFGGVPMAVVIPTGAVLAIYAKENGQGMLFSEEDDGGDSAPPEPQPPSGKPTLRVVK